VDALDVLAQNNFGDTRSGSLAGPLGLLIIVLLALATVFLIRNMNARLRRLPDRFPGQDQDQGHDQPADGMAGAGDGLTGSADGPTGPTGAADRPTGDLPPPGR
jgi:hypothetical protein